jgi:DNA polymerase-3 subunit beta
MKLSCLQENLSKGLGIIGRAVATRATLPITQNVLLVAEGSRLRLSATNLEIAITTWVSAKVEQEGAIAVPARLLTDFISSLPNERVDIEGHQQPTILDVECARFEAKINGVEADEFPPIPTVDGSVTAKIAPQALRTAINQVVFAAATDDSRPVLTGVYVELEGEQFVLAAADGFRLAVHRGALSEPVGDSMNVLIPARTLSEVNRLLGDQDDPVEFTVTSSQNQLLIKLTAAEMVSQLKPGTFPNYSQLIPHEHNTRAVVGVKEFLRATRTASIFARDGSGIVRLQFFPGVDGTPGRVEISSRAEEVGENKGQIDAQIEGQESKIAFSSRYLQEALGALDVEEVVVESMTPSSPGVFRPSGDESYIHVVMPMFVQW